MFTRLEVIIYTFVEIVFFISLIIFTITMCRGPKVNDQVDNKSDGSRAIKVSNKNEGSRMEERL